MKSNRLVLGGVVLLAMASGGCFVNELLNVDVPDRVTADELDDPRNAHLLVASAVADFECAFARYIVAAGLLGDELADAQSVAPLWDYDRRTIDSTGTPVYAVFACADPLPGIYQTLQTARFSADHAIQLLQSPEFVAALDPIFRSTLLATAAAYSGFSHLLLGEAMCHAAVDGGPRLTSQELLQLAEEKLTQAIDTGLAIGATAGDSIVYLARVGRARARLDLGRGMEAAADAQLVPPGFRREARYSKATFRSSNRIERMNNFGFQVTIEDDFRPHNVIHMGQADPRVLVLDAGRSGLNPKVPLWTQTKYPEQDSPIPIARYTEAQLIIAEVMGGETAVGIINSLHTAAGLPAFAASEPDAILRHVIEERKLELFLESHHLHDKLRFNALLDPDPLPDTPPAGATFVNGGPYGPTRCLPLPEVERLNNPNIP